MKKSTIKEIIELLRNPSLDFEATVIELAKEYPTIFLKCAVAPKKDIEAQREIVEKQVIVPIIHRGDFILAIKTLRDLRREQNLDTELQTLLRCKNDCERWREELKSGVVKINTEVVTK